MLGVSEVWTPGRALKLKKNNAMNMQPKYHSVSKSSAASKIQENHEGKNMLSIRLATYQIPLSKIESFLTYM